MMDDDADKPVELNRASAGEGLASLQALRDITAARIGLPRCGSSLSTESVLSFDFDHAQARDAVHLPFDVDAIEAALQERALRPMRVHSAAIDRRQYLQRPDLGRRLDPPSRRQLQDFQDAEQASPTLALVIADGLSTTAVHTQAVAVIDVLLPLVNAQGWDVAPVVVAEQARVALGDEIGECLAAKAVAVLIGERPGLSAADSLGIYFTYSPHRGRSDAERNCISNIHGRGLSPEAAALQLRDLLCAAQALGLSGTRLKL